MAVATREETSLAAQPTLPEVIEQALVQGNLANLTPADRVILYNRTCASLGLNPLTTPFQYITLNGNLVLYATRNCTDQLRKIHSVDVSIMSRERIDDIYVVTARGTLPNGRSDEEIGAVPIAGLKGESLANAMMKAGTKAKRRVTLGIVGLSLLDETEIESIPNAQPANIETIPPSSPRQSTPARPVQQQPEPAPVEEERARAMVGEVVSDRQVAEFKYAELSKQAIEKAHPDAETIKGVDPSKFSDKALTKMVEKLEAWLLAQQQPEVDEAF